MDQRVQKALFIFACTNSVMDPIVYGFFNLRKAKRSNPGGGGGGCVTSAPVSNAAITGRTTVHMTVSGFYFKCVYVQQHDRNAYAIFED